MPFRSGLPSLTRRVAASAGWAIDYASTAAFVNGWLLTVRDRNLIAQRFDPSDLTLAGMKAP